MATSFDKWRESRERQAFALRARQVRAFDEALHPTTRQVEEPTTSSAGAAAPLGRYAPVGLGRWRVERAGSLTGGYGPGWVAYTGVNLNTHGEWFATWQAAWDYAVRQAV